LPILERAVVVVGIFIDGVYLATAWVVSVMLPPMAIFFPLFTLLKIWVICRASRLISTGFSNAPERTANKPLTMMMGYGCNAAGVVSTRILTAQRASDCDYHEQFCDL
jgi:ferrous iron transport protein B